MKKIINVLLILLLCSVSAFSFDWNFEDDVLTISGEGKMPDFISEEEVPWYDYQYSITSIVIDDGVQSIGNYAFSWCDSLESITIPDSVQAIGDDAFAYCKNLESIVIGDGVQSIGNRAFFECDNLKRVVIPNSVQSIDDYAFRGCDNLESITIPEHLKDYFEDFDCKIIIK